MEEAIFQAPLSKRILAAFLDVSATLLLAIAFFLLLVNGALDIGFHNLNHRLAQYRLQEESGLFLIHKDDDGNYLEISALSYREEEEEEYQRFIVKIRDYYFSFASGEEKTETYFNTHYMLFDPDSLQNAIFSVSSLTEDYSHYLLLDEVRDVSSQKKVRKEEKEEYLRAVKNFFMDPKEGVYPLALSEFTKEERFQSIVNELEAIERVEILLCVAFSSFLFLSLPILFNRNGESAFMHLLGICFTDSDGYRVKWRHKIIRALTVVMLNAVSVYFFGIPLLVNAILCLLTPEKRSLLDYASNLVAIDKKSSVIVENEIS